MKEVWQDLGKRPLVAASLGGGERLVDSARRATKLGADLIEVRVDSLSPKERANISKILEAIKEATPCPLIITVRRGAEQETPGKAGLDDRDRKILFEDSLPFADCIDVEIESDSVVREVMSLARKDGKKIILSYHDFTGIPDREKMELLTKSFTDLGGDVLKVAAMAKTQADVLKIMGLCQSMDGKKRVFIAMGETGKISRAAGFLYGSCLTYGYMSKPTAPGQLPVEELIDLCALFYPAYAKARFKKI